MDENHVLDQNPASGLKKAAGTKVVLVIGKGPKTGRLPRLGRIVPRTLPPYIAYDPPAGGIWLIKPDGSDAHQVGPPEGTSPVWSPDAAQILFNAPAPANNQCIDADTYLMNADGAGSHPIMASSGGCKPDGFPWGDSGFQWSPDGKQIVFTDAFGHVAPGVGIGIADADGSHQQLVNVYGGVEASFAPDGRYLVFVGSGSRPSSRDADEGIYVVKPDGTGLRQLTFGGEVGDPSWSPDGTRIVYECLGADFGSAHGVCELAGNPARQRILYRNGNETFFHPTWNANGTKILVTVQQTPEPYQQPQGPPAIALMSPSGGPPVKVANVSGAESIADW